MSNELELELTFCNGLYQGFETLPDESDAIYFYSPKDHDVLLFDSKLLGYPELQTLIRNHLVAKVKNKVATSAWLLGHLCCEWAFSLSELGLSLLPLPLENPYLGSITDTTPIINR